MNIGDTTIIGTQDVIQLNTLHPSWNLIVMLSLLKIVSLSQIVFAFSVIFLFLLSY